MLLKLCYTFTGHTCPNMFAIHISSHYIYIGTCISFERIYISGGD